MAKKAPKLLEYSSYKLQKKGGGVGSEKMRDKDNFVLVVSRKLSPKLLDPEVHAKSPSE